MKLERGVENVDERMGGGTHATSKFKKINIKPPRTPLSVCARRASRSCFSQAEGTAIMNERRTILATDTKMANPDKPVGDPDDE